MPDLNLHIAATLGLLLGVSLIAGIIFEYLHIPKVTAYLLVGLGLGHSFLNVLDEEHIATFDPMLKMAMALVLFGLGCHFPFSRIRRIAARGLVISAGELILTFTVVFVGLLVFQTSLSTAILLGCLALATAPATTVLVLKEYRSEGPVTEYTGFMVALNNLACIVAFELAFLVISILSGSSDVAWFMSAGVVARDIAGSIAVGVISGFLLSYGCGLMGRGRWIVLLVATSTFLLGICESLGIPYMLTFLVMGVTLANSLDYSDKVVEELDHLTGLLCVLFFAVHGAELDISKVQQVGIVGAVYIVCRIVGKYFGVYIAARLSKQPIAVRQWLGTSLFAQAGAAISLATIAEARDSELGGPILTIILGSVVFFEIIGPLLIKQSILRAGEVPIAQAIHHTHNTPLGQIREITDRVISSWRRSDTISNVPRNITVRELMRRHSGLHQTANFETIVSYLEAQHDNTLPVVSDQGTVVGVIRFSLVGNVLFDKTVNQLVRAEDLAIPVRTFLHPEDSVTRAFELFQVNPDDCIPVVSKEEPQHLLGIVRRSDIKHMLIRQRRTSGQTPDPS